jgi:hypothetical protein
MGTENSGRKMTGRGKPEHSENPAQESLRPLQITQGNIRFGTSRDKKPVYTQHCQEPTMFLTWECLHICILCIN